jgi:peptidoglycan hydrolase-like protein with peptidoglycan-binding domain
METLAYLHHACAYEASENSGAELTLLDGYSTRKSAGTALIRVLSLVVSLSILSLASAAVALQLGDQGTAVSTLQTQLQATGCLTGEVDGVFGPQTEQAVKCLQLKSNLTADGVVGPQTQAALTGSSSVSLAQFASKPAAGQLLRPGDSGDAVSQVQARLADLNYFDTSATGHFGPLTVDAVKRFQADRGLVADGIVGPQTYKALGIAPVVAKTAPSLPPPSEVVIDQPSLRVGSSGVEVEVLQNRLKALGFFNGPVTGYYGSLTQAAVMRYQQSQGLPATGVANAQTLDTVGVVASRMTSRRYVVVIPQADQKTLPRVQQMVPGARTEKSKLGEFVNAGTFFDRDSADRHSARLRNRGLDARVAYR